MSDEEPKKSIYEKTYEAMLLQCEEDGPKATIAAFSEGILEMSVLLSPDQCQEIILAIEKFKQNHTLH